MVQLAVRCVPVGAQLMVRLSWFKYMLSIRGLCSGEAGEGFTSG